MQEVETYAGCRFGHLESDEAHGTGIAGHDIALIGILAIVERLGVEGQESLDSRNA